MNYVHLENVTLRDIPSGVFVNKQYSVIFSFSEDKHCELRLGEADTPEAVAKLLIDLGRRILEEN